MRHYCMNRNLFQRCITWSMVRFRFLYKYVPDSIFLKIKYWAMLGKRLDLNNPISFNEKLQWLKIHDRNIEYCRMVDKYSAKEYVASIIGNQYIIPTLGVWDCFDEIDFDSLPDQFVLKCTHDSGGLVICRDKSKFDIAAAKKKIEKSQKNNYFYEGREWQYKYVKPRIIAEKYMDDGHEGLRDYKFFGFNGVNKFLYVSEGLENHSTARISFYDFEGNQLPFKRKDYKSFDGKIDFPPNMDKLKEISDKLVNAIGSVFVRTDFYNISGDIYFSEITFSPCGGMIPFSPEEWDEKIGEWLDISTKKG